MSWRDQAACTGTDPDVFFPTTGKNSRRAKRVCRDCRVVKECAFYADQRDIIFVDLGGVSSIVGKYGVWGGMTEQERRRLRVDTKASPVGFIAKPVRGR